MHKLSRVLFWAGIFVATITLAIGVSLLAVRVRAAMDARRSDAVQTVAPAADETLQQPVSASPTSCVAEQTVCPVSPGSEASSSTAGPSLFPTPTPATYRDCCGNIRVVPTAIPQTQSNPGALAAPQPSADETTPVPPSDCH